MAHARPALAHAWQSLTRQACSSRCGGLGERLAPLVRAPGPALTCLRGFSAGPQAAQRSWQASGRLQGGTLVQQELRAQRRWLSTAAAELTAQGSPLAGDLAAGLSPGARRAVALWLGGCAGWVFSMVVLGGLTRLTRSGLSMTTWKFTGERVPRSQADWEAEFALYKASPEYQRVNRGMGLEDFKFIYWMEYAHRSWGRALGLVFLGPLALFAARGWLTRPLGARLALLGALGGGQGLVGWWMVRSGLQEPARAYEVPRVSPYRLAAHLTSAFVIYGGLLWTALSVAFPASPAAGAGLGVRAGAQALRRFAHPLAGLIALTAFSGAFVAGLDAGHAFNTFPLMGGRWVPEEYWDVWGWRNAFENPAAAQLHHRALALSTLAAVGAVWWRFRPVPLPGPSRLLLHGLAGMAALQVTLGVSTLLLYVPVGLGTAHQAGALTLLTLVLGLLHTLRRSPKGLQGAVRMSGMPREGLVGASHGRTRQLSAARAPVAAGAA